MPLQQSTKRLSAPPRFSILHEGWELTNDAGLSVQAILLGKVLSWHLTHVARRLTTDHPHRMGTMLLFTYRVQILPVNSSLSSWHSKYLTSLLVKAEILFLFSPRLPSPSGLQLTAKFKSEVTDSVTSAHALPPHFLPLI